MTFDHLILILAAAALLLTAEGLYYLMVYRGQRRRAELLRRLRSLEPGEDRMAGGLMRERRLSRSPALARLLAGVPQAEQLERLLMQTDLSWTVATLLGIAALAGSALSLVLACISHQRRREGCESEADSLASRPRTGGRLRRTCGTLKEAGGRRPRSCEAIARRSRWLVRNAG